jgi:hypothetical protein
MQLRLYITKPSWRWFQNRKNVKDGVINIIITLKKLCVLTVESNLTMMSHKGKLKYHLISIYVFAHNSQHDTELSVVLLA